ncbi:Pycsar system effector family protein [Streptosporangium sp. NPDC050855]|uniref:Pycsar system effector family protein n=1 Tax=Streptosporangium sp. NPDC050855 TaxID=3366194 RepID=UPI0037BC619B
MHLYTTPLSAASTEVSPTAPRCDNRRVGILLDAGAGRWLMLHSANGITGLTGHVDSYPNPEQAARALVADALDLTLTGLELVATTWRGDHCERLAGSDSPDGHNWHLYRARVDLEALGIAQLQAVHCYTAEQLKERASRTALYASLQLSDAEFAADPGIAPVWVEWLITADVITMADGEKASIDWSTYLTAPAVALPWQQAHPQQPWHRAPAPVLATRRPVPAHLQRVDAEGATDLIAEAAAARSELARTDTKAGLLLSVAGTAASVLLGLGVLASGMLPAGRVGLGAAVALLAAAAATVLTVIRPSLPRPGSGTGFTAHATLDDAEQLLSALADDPETRRAKDVIRLSQIAAAKYRRLRVATDLMLLALAVVVVSLPSLL